MISQMVVGVGNHQVEHDPRPQFPKIGVGLRAVIDQDSRDLEVARACRSVVAVLASGECHRRREMQPPPCFRSIKSLHQKGVVRVGEPACQTLCDLQPATARQRVHHQFPGTHVVLVAYAGKLGDPEVAVGIDHACLGSRATQRSARRDQHAQPVIALRSGVILVTLERQAGGLEFAQLNKWRRCKVVPVIQKVTGIVEAKPQRTDTEGVMHAKQIVRLDKAHGLGRDPSPLLALQSASHEQPSPTIRAGIGEDAEGFTALLRVLTTCVETQPQVEL